MLSILDYNGWRGILSEYKKILPDVYYDPDYFETWREHEQAEPYCLHARAGGSHFIYPFFKKPIKGYDTPKQYFDIFTAYGYGGLLCADPDPNDEAVEEVNRQIDDWCAKQDIVAEFIRENYLHEYKGKYLRQAEHVQVRTNVYAGLTDGAEKLLSSSAKRNVKKALKAGLTSSISSIKEHQEQFCRMYSETMDRTDAEAYYYFQSEYFVSLANAGNLNAELVTVWKDTNQVSGAICFRSGKKYIYHLGASDLNYLDKRSNDYLFHSIIQRARELGMRYVFWGGGMSNDDNDSLLRFKLKYANESVPCHIGKKVHNKVIYQTLCEQWKASYPQLNEKYASHLLKYHYTM